MTPEGRVKAKVKRALATLQRKFTFMPVQNGMGAPGLDWFNCINGRFVAIETKAPGKRLTPRQETTKANIEYARGLVFVCDTDESIERMLRHLQWLDMRSPPQQETPHADT